MVCFPSAVTNSLRHGGRRIKLPVEVFASNLAVAEGSKSSLPSITKERTTVNDIRAKLIGVFEALGWTVGAVFLVHGAAYFLNQMIRPTSQVGSTLILGVCQLTMLGALALLMNFLARAREEGDALRGVLRNGARDSLDAQSLDADNSDAERSTVVDENQSDLDVDSAVGEAPVDEAHAPKLGPNEVSAKTGPRTLLYAFVVGASYQLPLAVIIGALGNWFAPLAATPAEQQRMVSLVAPPSISAVIFGFITVAVIAPVTEEFFFRGAMFRWLSRSGSRFYVVVATALMFGLSHVSPRAVIYAFMLGMVLGVLRETSGRLWLPIAFHAGFNAMPPMLSQAMKIPAIASGGTRLITITVVGSSVLALAGTALFLRHLKRLRGGATSYESLTAELEKADVEATP